MMRVPPIAGFAVAFALIGGCAAETPQEVALSSRALESDGECLIGDETLEHACLHALHGPFVTVTAQPHPGTVFTDVNAPHTAFTVQLPSGGAGFKGGVLYQPTVAGEFGLLFDQELNVALYDSTGALVEPVGSAPGDSEICAQIGYVTVYDLSDAETYTVVLDTATTASPVLIVEYLGEHASCDVACEPLTLVASRTYQPAGWEDAELTLDHHVVFELPRRLIVTQGRAGSGLAVLTVEAEGEEVVCRYRGNGKKRYVFERCNNDAQPGDDVEAEYLSLHVKSGDKNAPGRRTTVTLSIQPECGDHDHEGEGT